MQPVMKLSETTFKILENFSGINQSIAVKSGNKLRTISVMKNILAEADVDEDFSNDFAIYDLSQFLSLVRVVHGIEDSELKFNNEKFVTISDGKNKTNYFFADPSVIVSPPDKNLSLPTEDVDFRISQHQLTKLKQSAAILNLPDLSIVGDGEKVVVKIHDRKTDSSNDFGFTVGETEKTFTFNFKLENIKLINGDYNVQISRKLLSKWSTCGGAVRYYIALEPDFEFEE